jgi:hypothetical protein
MYHWASSTLSSYDRHVYKYAEFCVDRGVGFPPEPEDTAIVADYLCVVADKSERPESALKSTSAAVSCYYQGAGLSSPMEKQDIRKLSSALVKSGTKRPAQRTSVMPCTPYYELFENWPSDDQLGMVNLRLKTVTLLALAMMTRPSDLAPKGVFFNAQTGEKEAMLFERDQVVFHPDGSATITLFGIKNDRTRSGFEVRLPGGSNSEVDPVGTLKTYMTRTESQLSAVKEQGCPVFLSLKPPFHGIRSAAISQILNEAIKLAGLGGMGYSARSFRPTGATAAVQAGTKPETAMQIG